MEDRCQLLREGGFTNFFVSMYVWSFEKRPRLTMRTRGLYDDLLTAYVSSLILVGLLLSYVTQHYRIISRGSSNGISPYFVLLGVTSANAQFGNILTLPASRADVACCKEVSPFECMAGLLGIAQIGTQWACFAVMLVHFQ
jgi:hypothetical protein